MIDLRVATREDIKEGMDIVFGIARLVAKCKGRKGIHFIDFFAKYMFVCSVPVFLLFFVQLAMSGQWVMTNIIIACLPLLYGLIIQLIFMLIKKKITKEKYFITSILRITKKFTIIVVWRYRLQNGAMRTAKILRDLV